eukprot:GHVP01068490.1.p1 GENE.GHVP01068490.1~~GHVP01068490.1.p1  ORF type:complete len:344 (-),score=9.71 GHVP01068490.1:440-1471(-)
MLANSFSSKCFPKLLHAVTTDQIASIIPPEPLSIASTLETSLPRTNQQLPIIPPRRFRNKVEQPLYEKILQALKELIYTDIIEEIDDPPRTVWSTAANLMPVVRKDTKIRLTADFSPYESIFPSNASNTPAPFSFLSFAASRKYHSTIDITAAFYRFKHSDNLYVKMDFCVFRYKRLPMGLQSSPAILQEILTRHLTNSQTRTRCYLDDIVVVGDNLQETTEITNQVITPLKKLQWTINTAKTAPPTDQPTKILGWMIQHQQLLPNDPQNVLKALRHTMETTKPFSISTWRHIYGVLNVFRRLTPNFALLTHHIAKHLTTNQPLTPKIMPKLQIWKNSFLISG